MSVVNLMLLSLSMGFLFLAGGFGLWVLKFVAEKESRRRLGRFVDAMYYVSDPLLLINRGVQLVAVQHKAGFHRSVARPLVSVHERVPKHD